MPKVKKSPLRRAESFWNLGFHSSYFLTRKISLNIPERSLGLLTTTIFIISTSSKDHRLAMSYYTIQKHLYLFIAASIYTEAGRF